MAVNAHEAAVVVRPLEESDLPAADHIMRLAFGTFLCLPEPASFMGDASYVASRWRSDPGAAFAAISDRGLVGSNFATNWGSVGFFGPLTVHPEHWDRGIGSRLLEPTVELLARRGHAQLGLFTFAHSPKHVRLYEKFGFRARYLTAVMAKPLELAEARPAPFVFSDLPERERGSCLDACREVTDRLYHGLDLEHEIRAAEAQQLGETVLLLDGTTLAGFAVCHCGAGTEAGSDTCYVKFGAVAPGPGTAERFGRLFDACEELAAQRGLSSVHAGVNLARREAYDELRRRGYRTWLQGVAMKRGQGEGYNLPGVYLIDDWR
jgi:GNAT superfamily N-acetyltransferase